MSAPFAPDVSVLFGPMLLGVILNTLLYGIMLVQVQLYFQRYKTDRRWFKYLIVYLVVTETANWVCDIGLIYEPVILHFGSPLALEFTPTLLKTDSFLTVLVSTPIQLFMAWRIHVVTRSLILPIIISILALASLGGGLAVSVVLTLHPKFQDFPSFRPEVEFWLISSAACDVVLTLALVYSLWVRKTHIKAMDSYINRVIRLTVQTGAITATAALADMFLTFIFPTTTVNFIVAFPLSKLYTNTLISTLNARPWKDTGEGQRDTTNVLFEPTPVGSNSNSSFILTNPRNRSTSLSQFQARTRQESQDSTWKSGMDEDMYTHV
ncbi:hypothetical protein C8R46DRAFT_1088299 [Mycena filopes]|nr:hypothetical protein C8R46DRAFT_1088299 [Mycena filopes]